MNKGIHNLVGSLATVQKHNSQAKKVTSIDLFPIGDLSL